MKLIKRVPSGHINQNSAMLGLSYGDVTGLASLLGILLWLFRRFDEPKLTYFALFLTFMTGVFLIPIRLKYRNHIIRDSLGFFFRRKVVYDPTNYSVKSFRRSGH